MMNHKRKNRAGFALVELAIVLGIVSLLVGGAVATSNVLQGSKENAVRKEIADIHTAYKDYRGKYGSMPGDTNNAETLFVGGSGSNGDGNGKLNLYPLEYNAFWTHLSLAQLIKGSYSIFATGPGALYPASVLGGGSGYTMTTRSPDRAVLQLCLNGNPSGSGPLTPEQLKKLDEQLDDGNPTSGRIVVEPANGVAATQCVIGGAYNSANTLAQCNLLYVVEGANFTNYQISGNGVASCGTLTAPTAADYVWDMGAWGSCGSCAWQAGTPTNSGTCGPVTQTTPYSCPVGCSGSQTRSVQCINAQTGGVVANANCAGSTPAVTRSCSGICPEPAPVTQSTVNLGSCETYSWYQQPSVGSCSAPASSWTPSAWSGCNTLDTSCPRNGTQTRTVSCTQPTGTITTTYTVVCRRDSDNAVVADGNCSGGKPAANAPTSPPCTAAYCSGPAPDLTQSCTVACNAWVCDGSWGPCSGVATWTNPAWGACSSGCGAGTQTRVAATCTSASGTQTRNCICPLGADYCGPSPLTGTPSDTNSGTQDVSSASQACTDTVCDAPTPATSQACTSGTSDTIPMTYIQTLYKQFISGSTWVGCIQ